MPARAPAPARSRSAPARSRVAVIFTGGTISMTVDPVAGGAVPTLAGADLLALVPGLDQLAEVVVVDRGRTPASHFSFADVLAIGAAIDAACTDPRITGVVVVQGTDTLEETAFAWDLCHARSQPVVVTGAMRNASDPGWDGAANLRAAVRLAVHPSARGAGVLVAIGGRVIAADDVAKRHSSAVDAFASRSGRPLGRVGERRVTMAPRGPRRRIAPVPTTAGGPVEIVTAALETDGRALDRAVAAGARAVVVAATGSGNTHPDLLRAAIDAHGCRDPGCACQPDRRRSRGALLRVPRRRHDLAAGRRPDGRLTDAGAGPRGDRPRARGRDGDRRAPGASCRAVSIPPRRGRTRRPRRDNLVRTEPRRTHMRSPITPAKHDLNRRLETTSWGLFLIMLGGFALLPAVPEGTWLLGAGVIMLGLNAVRLVAGIRVSFFTVILGTVALLSGLGSVYGVNLPVGPLLIILIGLAIIVRALDRSR